MKRQLIIQFVTRYWIGFWLAGICAVVIGSLLPQLGPPSDGILPLDKIAHFLAYAVLALLPMARIYRRELAFITTASIPVMGMLLEYAQRGVAGRDFSPEDMIANNLGALIGILIGIALRLNRRAARMENI